MDEMKRKAEIRGEIMEAVNSMTEDEKGQILHYAQGIKARRGNTPRYGPRPPRKKKPKPYRKHIDAYKHLREHGVGLMATWKPETFRDYIEGWRLMVVMNTAGAVGLVLYILYRIFLK